MANKKRNDSRNTFILILLSIPLLLVIVGVLVFQVTTVQSTLPTVDVPETEEIAEELNTSEKQVEVGEVSTTEFMKMVFAGTELGGVEPHRQEFTWMLTGDEEVKVNGFQLTQLKADEDLEKTVAAKIIELGLAIEEDNSYEDGNLRSRAFEQDNFLCVLLAIQVDSNQEAFSQVDLLCGELE